MWVGDSAVNGWIIMPGPFLAIPDLYGHAKLEFGGGREQTQVLLPDAGLLLSNLTATCTGTPRCHSLHRQLHTSLACSALGVQCLPDWLFSKN